MYMYIVVYIYVLFCGLLFQVCGIDPHIPGLSSQMSVQTCSRYRVEIRLFPIRGDEAAVALNA